MNVMGLKDEEVGRGKVLSVDGGQVALWRGVAVRLMRLMILWGSDPPVTRGNVMM